MTEDSKYYVVKQKALPEVLLKVAQVNKIIETKRMSIAEATESVGISRSSYYKYKDYKANLLTIHQTIPVNGVASLTLSVDILPTTGDSAKMIEQIEQLSGVRYLKILSRE